MRRDRMSRFCDFGVLSLITCLLCGFVSGQGFAQQEGNAAGTDAIDVQVVSLLNQMQLIGLHALPGTTKDITNMLGAAAALYPYASSKGQHDFADFPDHLKGLEVTERAAGHQRRAESLKAFIALVTPSIENAVGGQPEEASKPPDVPEHLPTTSAVIQRRSPTTDMRETLLKRGNQMLGLGQVEEARMFYERAAEMGSAEAAQKIGDTYDSRFIAEHNLIGLQPDADKAAEWYRKAKAMRSPPEGPRMSADRSQAEQSP